MCGSGVRIGTAAILQIQKTILQDRIVCCVAGVGTPTRGAAVFRAAAASPLATAAAAAGFGWFLSHEVAVIWSSLLCTEFVEV